MSYSLSSHIKGKIKRINNSRYTAVTFRVRRWLQCWTYRVFFLKHVFHALSLSLSKWPLCFLKKYISSALSRLVIGKLCNLFLTSPWYWYQVIAWGWDWDGSEAPLLLQLQEQSKTAQMRLSLSVFPHNKQMISWASDHTPLAKTQKHL